MIIYVKSSEIDDIIEKLGSIEESFWLNYRNYNEKNRLFLEDCFEKLYANLYKLIDGEGDQIEMPMEVQKSYKDDPDESEVIK